MNIRRVVPDIKSQHLAESRAFYVDFLGMEMAMDTTMRNIGLPPTAAGEIMSRRG